MEVNISGTILSRLFGIKKSNFELRARIATDNMGRVAVLKKITSNINRMASMVNIVM